MNLSIVLVLLAAATSISATFLDTNARRIARGLPPLPPVHRATPVAVAKRTRPSGTHNPCRSGFLQCCNSVNTLDPDAAAELSKELRIPIPFDIPIGLTCSPILLGLLKHSCQQQTVCCDNNQYSNGGVSIGCSPVDIHL